ncbi:MAG: DNA repair protein RecN [Chloroflexi bacterium]|nr:DNA repair protein RecN [Chloroflexota bacterium]
MLAELTITDFAIIDHLHLQLSPGFNVLTGETGAGKSIIIDAVGLLLGGRADTHAVRAGADMARVEGVFLLDDSALGLVRPMMEELGLLDPAAPDDAGTIIISRDIQRAGRNVCRINGRAVPLRTLQQMGDFLIDIHGQGDHLALMRPKDHVEYLDRFAGLSPLRGQVAELVRQVRQVRREMQSLRTAARERERRIDLLTYQAQEIQDALLQPGEDEALQVERQRLSNAEKLIELAQNAYERIYAGRDDLPAAFDQVNDALRDLSQLRLLDPTTDQLHRLAEEITFQFEDLSRSLRTYRDAIDLDPGRLEAVEERLDLIFRLKRKYGDTIEAILAFGAEAAQELDKLQHSEERLEDLSRQEAHLLADLALVAAALSAARAAAATTLGQAIEQQLADLAMSGARFTADFQYHPDPEGVLLPDYAEPVAFDHTGVDRVEFMIAPNQGEPFAPLVKIASGGETARLMLAMKTVLSQADPVPTLIFDEVDAGVGGRVGEIVGQKLWGLAGNHQVLCVTHLPQIASFGETHLHVRKSLHDGRTTTVVKSIRDQERIEELSNMLGFASDLTRQKAAEMLQQSSALKTQKTA